MQTVPVNPGHQHQAWGDEEKQKNDKKKKTEETPITSKERQAREHGFRPGHPERETRMEAAQKNSEGKKEK